MNSKTIISAMIAVLCALNIVAATSAQIVFITEYVQAPDMSRQYLKTPQIETVEKQVYEPFLEEYVTVSYTRERTIGYDENLRVIYEKNSLKGVWGLGCPNKCGRSWEFIYTGNGFTFKDPLATNYLTIIEESTKYLIFRCDKCGDLITIMK